MKNLPAILAVVLYILIYLLRSELPGWETKTDLFKSQRNAIDQKISQSLPSPQAKLLSGILLGQNKNLPGRLRLALRDTSTLHIVVASGQNLSMVAGFFLALSGLIRRRIALTLSLGAAVFYTLLTGIQVPILRAALMFALASIAQIYGRKNDGLRVLIITAAFMLLVNPKWLFDLSFQLSFLATFGVIVVSPVFARFFNIFPVIGQDLAVTLAAQVMVMPVIAQNFHQISLVSLFANVMVLWTIPFIMVSGALMLVLGVVGAIVNALLMYFIYIVQFFAGLPFAWEYVREQVWIVWAGYYMVLAAIVLLLNNVKREVTGRS